MKQHLSVLMLAARSTIYNVIGILALLAAAESALFYLVLKKAQSGEGCCLEEAVTKSGIPLVCAGCFLLLCAALSLNGVEFSGSRFRYTIRRLSVSEETTAILWAVYYMACFFVFWAFQLLVAFLLCRLYTANMGPPYVSGQTIFLAFYRNKFLHSLLPLEEIGRYIRNLVLIFCLGAAASCFSYQRGFGRQSIAIVILAAGTVGFFAGNTGRLAYDVAISLAALIITVLAANGARKERLYEEVD